MESEHDRSESSRWRIDPAPRKCVRGESAQRIGEEDQDIRRELRVAGRKEGRCEKRCKSEKVLRVGECMLRGVKDVGLEELAERKRDQCVRAPGEFPDDQVHVGGAELDDLRHDAGLPPDRVHRVVAPQGRQGPQPPQGDGGERECEEDRRRAAGEAAMAWRGNHRGWFLPAIAESTKRAAISAALEEALGRRIKGRRRHRRRRRAFAGAC